MDSALPCCTGATSTRPLMPDQNLTAARSLLKLAVHSASSAPTINVQKVSALSSAVACVAHFDKNAVKVQALIRKEFERNKNETRPEVVEVCHAPSAPTHRPNHALQVFTFHLSLPEPQKQRRCCADTLPLLCKPPPNSDLPPIVPCA